jgi:CheY-like chemotaxis protein
MLARTSRLALAFLTGLLLLASAAAQDFRQALKKPETAMEYWNAVLFEISVGKYDIAASNLKGFLEKMPTDEELIKIEEKEGMSVFLQFITIPETRKDGSALLERVTEVIKKHRSDPERIKKFVKNLGATEEERAYAITQLRKSGGIAIPYLVDMLRDLQERDAHVPILSGLLRLNRDTIPPLLAALDLPDSDIRAELIDVLRERQDPSAVAGLWYLTAPTQPALVRQHATAALSSLLEVAPEKLPPAKIELTQAADRYYQHKVKFPNPKAVTVWQWDPATQKMTVPPPTLTASQAEEYYGLRYARQALDFDPSYRPAQIIFLSIAMEKAAERAGLDQPLEKGSPTIKELLRSVNPELLMAVLERALTDKRIPVILGSVRTLGELAEVRATRLKVSQAPALVKALNFPDRRVQMAAADAILRIPGPPPPQSSGRVVEILRRAVAGEQAPRALVADANLERGNAVGNAVKQAGFEPVVVQNGRDALRQLSDNSDFDVILIDEALPDPGLPYLLAQLRSDVDSGLLPLFITIAPDRTGKINPFREESLKRQAERYRNTFVMRTTLDPELLKKVLPERVNEAMGKPLTAEERKNHAADAMVWLKRISTGEVSGYDVRPAEAVVLRALHSEALRPLAIEALRGLPGRVPQRELAGLVLDKNYPPELRSAAAIELSKHIQQYGLLLDQTQRKEIVNLFQAAEDPKLKGNVALVVGSMRPSAAKTGARLKGYAPPPPVPAEEKEGEKEKPKEKEKDKDKEKAEDK